MDNITSTPHSALDLRTFVRTHSHSCYTHLPCHINRKPCSPPLYQWISPTALCWWNHGICQPLQCIPFQRQKRFNSKMSRTTTYGRFECKTCSSHAKCGASSMALKPYHQMTKTMLFSIGFRRRSTALQGYDHAVHQG